MKSISILPKSITCSASRGHSGACAASEACPALIPSQTASLHPTRASAPTQRCQFWSAHGCIQGWAELTCWNTCSGAVFTLNIPAQGYLLSPEGTFIHRDHIIHTPSSQHSSIVIHITLQCGVLLRFLDHKLQRTWPTSILSLELSNTVPGKWSRDLPGIQRKAFN